MAGARVMPALGSTASSSVVVGILHPQAMLLVLRPFPAPCCCRPWAGHQTPAEMFQTHPQSLKGSRSRGGCRNNQRRQMSARLALEAWRRAPYLAWGGSGEGRLWETLGTGRRTESSQVKHPGGKDSGSKHHAGHFSKHYSG